MRLIDANALVPYLWALFEFFGSIPCSEADKATQRAIKRCIGEVKKMPTVEAVEMVHGRWIVDKERFTATCSECGKVLRFSDEMQIVFIKEEERFCYYCGAKMDGTKRDEVAHG
jgi:hypothetical protein